MNKQAVYRLLETKMLSYKDYAGVPVQPIAEPLVVIPAGANLVARQIDQHMVAYTGAKVYVRRTVLRKLRLAAELLAAQDEQLQLEVVYGYRAPEIQKRLFEQHKAILSRRYTGQALLAATHRLIAAPEVAGHPAGAAVDIQITRNGRPFDFGTKMHQFTPDTFTFSPFIHRDAWDNRQLLRRVMMQADFAPFDGEWWHFSYGDKEWASYYHQKAALYEQLEYRTRK
ncbi:MAG TPA: M15 family metallopeptidase [Candidatus Saccharimonadales bacterium]|nr:M15 family metallopeptidase [Candidatus Saccharimonadales bacterium]